MRVLHFKTHAQIKRILGQDLINDDNVAVQELVKNSYDAGSKTVDIVFKNLKSNKDSRITNFSSDKLVPELSKIFIIDQGSGMTSKDIEDKWLNIAYSKKRDEKTRNGRVMAGAKGVGRFSCDRLGEFLDLYTKTKDRNNIIHLRINWNEFDKKDSVNYLIQNVNVYINESLTKQELERRTGYSISNSGTIIEISKLRTDWIDKTNKSNLYEKIIRLKTALEKLTNPNQNIDEKGFKIKVKVLDLSERDYDSTKTGRENYCFLKKELVENKIFTNLKFRTTYIESTLNMDSIVTKLRYRDKIIFELKERNVYKSLKDVEINLKLHFLNQYSKAYFKRYTGIRSVNFGSILMFVNGFRIPSYGDYGNDWLNIEVRKGQGRARYLGTRDLIGWFEINDKNNVFSIISNREGLVKNNPYRQLVGDDDKSFIRSYFYSVFRKLELFVVEGLDWDKIASRYADEDEVTELKTLMKDFEAQISSDKWVYDPSKEKYTESEHEKNLRIIKQVLRIVTIGTKKKDIISLYINEDVLSELANENIDFVKTFVNQIDKLGKVNFTNKTSKDISQIRNLLEEMRLEQEKATERAEEAEEKAKEEEEKREEVEEEKKRAETENIFLKSTNLQEKEQVISLFHHIGIHSDTIKSQSGRILKEVAENKPIPDKAIKRVESIAKLSQIINTISKIGFKGGITEGMETEKQDIIQFMDEFINNICKPYYVNIDIDIENKIKGKYIKVFAPFELTYIIDNFISNSKKANASKISFNFYEKGNNAVIEITDDGDGLNPKVKDIDNVFMRNVSTTRGGAGLGLFDARKIFHKMDCKISAEMVDNGFKLKIVVPHED